MVETLLLREYPEEDVVVCYLENLEKFIGPETQVVAIHAHNPLGISYATDVYSKIAGKNLIPLNAAEFLKIVTHPVIKKYRPKVVIGGPGSIPGAFGAALLVGQVQTVGVLVAPTTAPFALLAVLLAVLTIRHRVQPAVPAS